MTRAATGHTPIIVTVAIALLSLVISGLTAYNHNDKELTSRVVKVETRQDGTDKRGDDFKDQLNRIETKLDNVLERVH